MGVEQHLPDGLRSKYAFKLFAISAVIVAVILAFGSVMALQVSDRVTESQLRSTEANAELKANALGRWLEGEQEALRIFSSDRGITAENRTETRETLDAELATQSDELAELHVVERATEPGSNGTTERIVASTNRSIEGGELAETGIFWGENVDGNERNFTFDGQDDILTSWVFIDGDEPRIAVATPTADGDHVLIGEYRPSVRVQQSVNVVNSTDTVVLGGVSGWVIFDETSPEGFRRYKGQVNSTEVGARILDRDDPNSIISGSSLDGDEVRGYHSVPTEGIDWVVVKEVPRRNALALTSQVQGDLALLIGIMVVGFLLLGFVTQRGPIQSIKRRAQQANAIADGNLDLTIEETDRIDEVGQLTDSLRNTKSYIETISLQSRALSRQEFDAEVLEEDIPGSVGESMTTMRRDLERFITQLEAERERYSTLVEQSNDGIVLVKDGQYAFANEPFVEISGYERERLYEMSLEALIVPEDREFALEQYERRMADDGPLQTYELGIETASGERRVVEISVSRITHDGAPAALINVRDITDRQRREQRLNIFNRVLRHNLRNNLQPVRAALFSAEDDTEDPEFVRSAIEQLDDLLDTATTARRIEEGFGDIEILEFDLRDVLTTLEGQASEAYPAATVTLPADTARVEAAHVLQEALWELVENAIEHGAGPVDIEVERRDDVAVIHVSDDGDGVPETEQAAIESGGETDLTHASGLGLWFAYWTAKASGGDLTFDVNGGTTISVTLPLADA